LVGKTTGEGFDFIIAAASGYGEYDADKLAEIPIEAFQGPDGSIDEEMVQPGNELPMVDSDGNRLLGIVDEVTPEFVRMDFNHPLAGSDLHFTGIILNVREASQDEISHGHVHGPHGHQH
jgi:FKBP-type peptidyl-prolyl cis-trans isomerase SlyD